MHMTDSTDPKRDNSRAALEMRLAKYAENLVAPIHKENIEDLPRWVKTALVMRAVDGMSYKEAAERVGRKGDTLSQYAKSPAAKKWMESLLVFLDDPIALAKAYLGANALSVTLERFAFLEAAVAAGDYREGDKIARDLQDRIGIGVKKTDTGAISVKIQLGGGTIDAPIVEAEWSETETE